jgi:hypothetical protein
MKKIKKTQPAVPQRGPEAGLHRLSKWIGYEPNRFIFGFPEPVKDFDKGLSHQQQ